MKAAPISRNCEARRYFVEKRAARRLCRSRKAAAERSHQGRDRNPAGFRPRYRARTPGLGRRLGRRRHAVPRRNHPRLFAGHASALSDGSGGEDDVRRRKPAGPYRDSGSSTTRISRASTRWCRRACRMLLALIPGDPDGARHRARKGAGLDHQSLRHAGHAHRISARQADSLYRRRHDEFCADVPDGVVCLPGAAQGKLPRAARRRRALRHRDDGLRHADFGVRQHADRGTVRHRHSDGSAGDAVLRHDDAGVVARRDGADHGTGVSR